MGNWVTTEQARSEEEGACNEMMMTMAEMTEKLTAAKVLAIQVRDVDAEYSRMREIGEGAFGTVYSAVPAGSGDGARVAVKKLDKRARQDEPESLRLAREEANLLDAADLLRVSHPNIVSALRVLEDDRWLAVEMPLATQDGFTYVFENVVGDSADAEPEQRSEAELRAYFRSVARGLAALHGAGFAHGDVKHENVVLLPQRDGAADEPAMIDFDTMYACERFYETEARAPARARAFKGTKELAPPELANGDCMGTAMDVFMFGLLVLESFVMFGSGGFIERTELVRRALGEAAIPGAPSDDGEEEADAYYFSAVAGSMADMIEARGDIDFLLDDKTRSSMSAEAKALLVRTLRWSPMARPTMEDVLADAWFAVDAASETVDEVASLPAAPVAVLDLHEVCAVETEAADRPCVLRQCASDKEWIEQYRLSTRAPLGAGASGIVYLAQRKCDGHYVALKVLTKQAGEEAAANARREIEIQASLRHPHILPIAAAYEDPERIAMELPLAARTLAEAVRGGSGPAGPGLDAETARRILKELVEAVAYLAQEGVVHSDIKVENVLLVKSAADGLEHAMLADFGSAQRECDVVCTFETMGFGSFRGSPHNCPPEIAGFRAWLGCAADVWALGSLAHELLLGAEVVEVPRRESETPEACNDRFFEAVAAFEPAFDGATDAGAFLNRALCRDPCERATAAKLLAECALVGGARRHTTLRRLCAPPALDVVAWSGAPLAVIASDAPQTPAGEPQTPLTPQTPQTPACQPQMAPMLQTPPATDAEDCKRAQQPGLATRIPRLAPRLAARDTSPAPSVTTASPVVSDSGSIASTSTSAPIQESLQPMRKQQQQKKWKVSRLPSYMRPTKSSLARARSLSSCRR